ncbi:exo-alpha-sialidase [soil metagenome]
MALVVLAGTKKGLFLLRSDELRQGWTLDGPHLVGWSVYHAILDPRDGVLHACTNHEVYGATVHRSHDLGKTWEHAENLGLPDDSELTLERTWHVEPGHADQPGSLWLGAAPGVLFRSNDGGAPWQTIEGLLAHPTRERWFPGAGGMCCHSIQLDPTNPNHFHVGISAAGVFRTDDGGEQWTPVNSGTAAEFLPDPYPEVGQCVHKLLRCAESPRLWQQHHCGVSRSDDGGESWQRLDRNGLPSGFGFAFALHPRDPDTAFVVPIEGAENRVTSGGRLGVYRTSDAGASWDLSMEGLPERAWTGVLREGMAFDSLDPFGLYLGAQSGSVFASADEGQTWTEIASQLPPVLSVEVGAWS